MHRLDIPGQIRYLLRRGDWQGLSLLLELNTDHQLSVLERLITDGYAVEYTRPSGAQLVVTSPLRIYMKIPPNSARRAVKELAFMLLDMLPDNSEYAKRCRHTMELCIGQKEEAIALCRDLWNRAHVNITTGKISNAHRLIAYAAADALNSHIPSHSGALLCASIALDPQTVGETVVKHMLQERRKETPP